MRAFSPMFGALLRNSKFNIIERAENERKNTHTNKHPQKLNQIFYSARERERTKEKKHQHTHIVCTIKYNNNSQSNYLRRCKQRSSNLWPVHNLFCFGFANRWIGGDWTNKENKKMFVFSTILKYGIFFSLPNVMFAAHKYANTPLFEYMCMLLSALGFRALESFMCNVHA